MTQSFDEVEFLAYRRLAAERRTPVPAHTPEDQRLADLRQVIHILAMALTGGRAVA